MPDPSTDPQALRPRLRRLLTKNAGAGAEPEATAAAAERLYEHLTRQLLPLVGEGGVTALGARALHLTEIQFPGLALPSGAASGDAPFTSLRVSLARLPPGLAADAASAFIAIFCGLLTSLIGDALTTRLLREAWPDGLQNQPEPETAT